MSKKRYAAYLESDHWKELRARKRAKVKVVRCGICGATDNLDTHHLFYRSLYDVQTSDLRLLCRECHSVAHEVLRAGFPRYTTHHGMFAALKVVVKQKRGFGNRNMFKMA